MFDSLSKAKDGRKLNDVVVEGPAAIGDILVVRWWAEKWIQQDPRTIDEGDKDQAEGGGEKLLAQDIMNFGGDKIVN